MCKILEYVKFTIRIAICAIIQIPIFAFSMLLICITIVLMILSMIEDYRDVKRLERLLGKDKRR